MIFSVIVRAAPDNVGHLLALNTCEELIRQGHQLEQIFFYESAVVAASALLLPEQDELSVTRRWQALSTASEVPLFVCVAAALKRGVVNEQEATSHALPAHNLADGFEIAGLGEWIGTLQPTIKQVTFA